MDDLLREFLTETSEALDRRDVELVKLEQDPNDPELLSSIFRLVHTIKGTCGFLGLPRLESVAHAGENVLGKFRDRELSVSPQAVTLILQALDRIKELLGVLEATEGEPEGNDRELIDHLNYLAQTGEVKDGAAADTTKSKSKGKAKGKVKDKLKTEPRDQEVSAKAASEPDAHGFVPVPAAQTAAVAQAIADKSAASAEAEAESESEDDDEAEAATPPAQAAAPIAASSSSPAARPGARAQSGGESGEGAKDKDSVANQSIRVSVDLLENLMTTVSELVLSRNQLLQMVRGLEDNEFTAPLQRLSLITSELQENVMKTRMQPIGNAWAKLPRIIRDLAQELGKKIELKMIGAETELDRQVLEMIKDPLTHMVRNSADHGLEGPEERRAAGKSEVGTVILNAYHEGGHIIIEIKDDGRGINVQKVREKLVQNGLATEAELDAMSVEQIQMFVFKAGFSTATKVTNVSGRGVGMDVVRTNIEKIGGTIEMKSVQGKGSRFIIKIPLTLAIVSALIVAVGGERFAMPQISVVELVRAAPTSEHRIETLNQTPVLRLRDRLLPLISLSHVLKLNGGKPIDVAAENFVIVVQVGTQNFGVIVDKVFDTEEIVVKPVTPILREINVFSGNTILGDGSVVMILDPNGLSTMVGALNIGDVDRKETRTSSGFARGDQAISLLLFRGADSEPKAVPLALVARLEEVQLSDIEWSTGTPVVQYRGELMPLITIDGAIDIQAQAQAQAQGKRPVLVFADRDRKMGLVVDEIVDIVEEQQNIELDSKRQGFLGSAVLAGKAHDVIDITYYLTQAYADWFQSGNGTATRGRNAKTKLLLVDDSAFFRNMITPMLEVAGYDVTPVESAEEALRLREDGAIFDMIISDIEMPGMSGFEFTEQCRRDGKWSRVPIVALSAHTAPEDFERAHQVGFDDYIAKFDRAALLSSLTKTLANVNSGAST